MDGLRRLSGGELLRFGPAREKSRTDVNEAGEYLLLGNKAGGEKYCVGHLLAAGNVHHRARRSIGG